jgi:miniconductance mechanosensitive channel
MADIFDHIIASIPYFDLELFEVQHVKSDKLNLLDIIDSD